MKLSSKSVIEWYYTDSKGVETPLKNLDNRHLLNAFAKVVSDLAGVIHAYKILAESKSEIIAAPHKWVKGATISVEQA